MAARRTEMVRHETVARSSAGAPPRTAVRTSGSGSAYATAHAIERFDQTGYLLVEDVFSAREVENIRTSIPAIVQERTERTVLEASQRTVRSVYGIHEHHP